jgi:hypothetical protein
LVTGDFTGRTLMIPTTGGANLQSDFGTGSGAVQPDLPKPMAFQPSYVMGSNPVVSTAPSVQWNPSTMIQGGFGNPWAGTSGGLMSGGYVNPVLNRFAGGFSGPNPIMPGWAGYLNYLRMMRGM